MPIVIDVVSGGVDWASIAVAGATVVAAIGGIWGTARQASRGREAAAEDLKKSLDAAAANIRLNIIADDERARIAEKRRIYAACQASFIAMIGPVIRHRREFSAATTPEQREAARSRLDTPRAAMFNAVSELRLIAPPDIGELANAVERNFMTFISDTNDGALLASSGVLMPEVAVMQNRLYDLMRQDLGVTNDAPVQSETSVA